jgi:hypothetical protein
MVEPRKLRFRLPDSHRNPTDYEKFLGVTSKRNKWGRDKQPSHFARIVVEHTGASYSTALREVRNRYTHGELRVYMNMVTSSPLWEEGQTMRCVHCLRSDHGRCP